MNKKKQTNARENKAETLFKVFLDKLFIWKEVKMGEQKKSETEIQMNL